MSNKQAPLQAVPQARPRKRRLWLPILAGLAILAILAVVLLPQLLVRQATQKPVEAETGTFVTREAQTTSLQDKMQQAIQTGGGNSGGQIQVQGQPQAQTQGQGQGQNQGQTMNMPQGQTQGQPQGQTQTQPQGQSQGQVQGQTQPDTQAPAVTYSQTTGLPEQPQGQVQGQVQGQPQAQTPTQPQTQAQAPGNGRFSVSLSESEISGMIYNGLNQGTAPQYRASIQGVSTKIQGGRARITVALLPRHLPEAFLKNLPGVTRDTPTVYLGGEMSLRQVGGSVEPDIHELALGNFKVPMPFIRDAVRATVQQQAAQMLSLPNGQRAVLDEVQLDGGALTLVGHAQ